MKCLVKKEIKATQGLWDLKGSLEGMVRNLQQIPVTKQGLAVLYQCFKEASVWESDVASCVPVEEMGMRKEQGLSECSSGQQCFVIRPG